MAERGLEGIALRDNSLEGDIPPELGNLASLEMLWLSDNDLTGGIPPELGNLSLLVELRLKNSALGGPIPLEFGNLPLTTLHWGGNDLCAPQNEDFQAWLRSIEDYGGGKNCSNSGAGEQEEPGP